jgi:hypothetical protein
MKKILLITTFLLSVSALANADEFKLENPYLQIGGGWGFKSGESEGGALKLATGFDLSNRFAVEGGYIAVSDVLVTDYDIFYLSFVAKQKLTEKMSLIGKVGITSWDSTEDFFFLDTVEDSGTSGLVGVELKYDFSESIAGLLSAEYFGGSEICPVMCSLRYTF